MHMISRKTAVILLRVMPYVAVVIALKLIVHRSGWEMLSLNPMFSGIIGATVFLLGFLLSGVLGDFKESEKIPGEISSMVLTIADELEISIRDRKDISGKEALDHLEGLGSMIYEWLHKREKTRVLLQKVRGLNAFFYDMERTTPPNFLARLKQEQNNLRKLIIRVHTIRETDFINSGYLIATTTSILLIIGLILVRIDPFYESLFFAGVISYLLIFLLMLIHDLDNPFGYYEKQSSEDVSLKPIEEMLADMKERQVSVGAVGVTGVRR